MMNNDDTIRVKKDAEVAAETTGENKNMTAKVVGAAVAGAAVAGGAAYAATAMSPDVPQEPDAPKTEEPKQEEPKAEEPKHEEPVAEKPATEEPKAEEPKQEEPKHEEPKAEEPKHEEPTHEEGHDFFKENDVEISTAKPTEDGGAYFGGKVNGHDAAFLGDKEGNIEAYAVDENDNHQMEDNEIHLVGKGQMDVKDMAENAKITIGEHDVTNNDDDGTLHVVAVEDNVDINGHSVNVAQVKIDNDDVYLIDANKDGEVNLMVSDHNHNNQLEDNEIDDVTSHHFQMPTIPDSNDGLIEASNDDLPDYSSDDYVL